MKYFVLSFALLSATPDVQAFVADPAAPSCDQEDKSEEMNAFIPAVPEDNCCSVGDPINPSSGEVYTTSAIDAFFNNEGSEFFLKRTYRSLQINPGHFGKGWFSTFDSTVRKHGQHYLYQDEHAQQFILKEAGSGQYKGIKQYKTIELHIDANQKKITYDGHVQTFSSDGKLTSIEFPSKQSLKIQWKGSEVVRLTDAWGKSLSLDYEGKRISKVYAEWSTRGVVHKNLIVTYSYDKAHRLVRIEYANGENYAVAYHPGEIQGLNHYLTDITDGEGRLVEAHKYDGHGRGIYSKGPSGEFEVQYQASASLLPQSVRVKVTNLATKKSSILEYDAGGRLVANSNKIEGQLGADRNSYSSDGLSSQKSGGTTRNLHYLDGRVTGMTTLAGKTKLSAAIEYAADAPTRLSMNSNLGNKLETTSEFKGNLLSAQITTGHSKNLKGEIIPIRKVTTFDYNSHGQLIRYHSDDVGSPVIMTYYGADEGLNSGRMRTLESREQKIEFGQYDFFGSPLVKTYNGKRRTIAKTDRAGKPLITHEGEILSYDRGGLQRTLSKDSKTVRFEYDGQRKVKGANYVLDTKRIEISKPTDSFIEDLERNFILSEDELGHLVGMAQKKKPSNQLKFSYDKQSRITGLILPDGQKFNKTYDDFGNMVDESSSTTGMTRRSFSADSRLLSEVDSLGNRKDYTYDGGKLTVESYNNKVLRSLAYAPGFSKPTNISSPGMSNTYQYDSEGRVTEETFVTEGKEKKVRYSYSVFHRDPATIIYPDGTQVSYKMDGPHIVSLWSMKGNSKKRLFVQGTLGDSLTRDYSDGKIRTEVKFKNAFDYAIDSAQFKADFKFDPKRMSLSSITSNHSDLNAAYAYSPKGFLAQVRTSGKDTHYDYDDYGYLQATMINGEKVDVEYKNWLPGKLASKKGSTSLKYDAKGRLVSKGDLVFAYNAYDLLSSVKNAKGQTLAEYVYDGNGRRVAKIVNGLKTDFVYDQRGQLIVEENSLRSIHYFYYQSRIVATKVTSAKDKTGNGEYFYPILDQTGSPLVVLDESGAVVAKSNMGGYDRKVVSKDGSDFAAYPFAYPGQYIDHETGLAYNFNRYFDPQLAQYTTSDPRGAMGGFNTYAYAFSNPNAYIDRSGLTPESVKEAPLPLPAHTDAKKRREIDAKLCGAPAVDMPAESSGQIWKVGNHRWTEEWEQTYSDWVKHNVNKDFYNQADFKLPTDCADASFAIRAIFARMHRLPVNLQGFVEGKSTMLGHDSTSFKGTSFSNKATATDELWETDWKKAFDKDKRFQEFLRLAKDFMIGTQGLPANTHPVKVTDISTVDRRLDAKLSKYISSGTIFLQDGHTYFIDEVHPEKYFPVSTLNSTVPSAVRNLSGHRMSVGEPEAYKQNDERGFLRWNHSAYCNGKWTIAADRAHESFSLQQYAYGNEMLEKTLLPDQEQYIAYMRQENGGKSMRNDEAIQYIARAPAARELKIETINDEISSIEETFLARVQIVEDGFNAGVTAPDGAEYDAHSTPSRDQAMRERLDDLENMINDFIKKSGQKVSTSALLGERKIPIRVEGVQLDIPLSVLRKTQYEFSSDPRDPVAKRWGISAMLQAKERYYRKMEDSGCPDGLFYSICKNYQTELKEYDFLNKHPDSSVIPTREQVEESINGLMKNLSDLSKGTYNGMKSMEYEFGNVGYLYTKHVVETPGAEQVSFKKFIESKTITIELSDGSNLDVPLTALQIDPYYLKRNEQTVEKRMALHNMVANLRSWQKEYKAINCDVPTVFSGTQCENVKKKIAVYKFIEAWGEKNVPLPAGVNP